MVLVQDFQHPARRNHKGFPGIVLDVPGHEAGIADPVLQRDLVEGQILHVGQGQPGRLRLDAEAESLDGRQQKVYRGLVEAEFCPPKHLTVFREDGLAEHG